MDTITNILIARCGGEMRDNTVHYFENRLYAMVHLNKNFEHKFGQPVMVNYLKENGEVDTIVAIGIKNGYGRDCYSIVSEGGKLYVGGVVHDLVDVSSLVHGIPYVVWYGGKWCLATIVEEGGVDSVRVIGDITTEDIIYNLSDGHHYYYKDGKIVREDSMTDFIKPQLDALEFGKLNLEVTPSNPLNGLAKKGSDSVMPEFEISVTTDSGEDITGRCSYSVSVGTTPVQVLYNNGVLYVQSGISNTTEYTITATYNLGESEVSETKKVTIEFVTPVLFGTGDSENEVLWNGRDPLVLYFDLDDSKSMVKVPIEYPEFDHIFDVHGLDYKDDYEVDTTTSYRIYQKLDAVTIHNFKQAFTYGSGNANN